MRDSDSYLYERWRSMFKNCRRAKCLNGISVCDEWCDFSAYEAWCDENAVGPDRLIVRVDKTKDYGPGNCIVVDIAESNRRRRCVHRYDGLCISEITGEKFSHGANAARRANRRIRAGWSVEDAVNGRSYLVRCAEESCGVEFRTNQPNQRFCSRTCSVRHNNRLYRERHGDIIRKKRAEKRMQSVCEDASVVASSAACSMSVEERVLRDMALPTCELRVASAKWTPEERAAAKALYLRRIREGY